MLLMPSNIAETTIPDFEPNKIDRTGIKIKDPPNPAEADKVNEINTDNSIISIDMKFNATEKW